MRRKLSEQAKAVKQILDYIKKRSPKRFDKVWAKIITDFNFDLHRKDILNSDRTDRQKHDELKKIVAHIDVALDPQRWIDTPKAYLAYLEKRASFIRSKKEIENSLKKLAKRLFKDDVAKQEGNKDNNQMVYEQILLSMRTRTKSQAVKHVAKKLGKAESTIWRKLKQYELDN